MVGIFIFYSYSSKLKFIIMAKNKETYKQEFIAKTIAKFGDKFDYSKVDYQGARSKVVIICPIHGEFQITPKGVRRK